MFLKDLLNVEGYLAIEQQVDWKSERQGIKRKNIRLSGYLPPFHNRDIKPKEKKRIHHLKTVTPLEKGEQRMGLSQPTQDWSKQCYVD